MRKIFYTIFGEDILTKDITEEDGSDAFSAEYVFKYGY